MEIAESDMLAAVKLMNEIGEFSGNVKNSVTNLIGKFDNDEISTKKGISLLELKCHLLLEYMMNITYVSLRKCKGQQIEKDESVLRLVELRTILEKLRPIESKLKYHIDKLLKFIPGNINENDPLRFRPNIDNLVFQNQEKSSDESEPEEEEKDKKTSIYEPPKLVPMHYDVDKVDKKTKLLEQAKKRALNSSIMQELRDEYYDGPEEIKEVNANYRKNLDAESRRRIDYEETHFMRVQLSAKEKHEAKKRRMLTGLDDLTHFGDMSVLTEKDNGDRFKSKKKGKKMKGKKKSIKGFKKKK